MKTVLNMQETFKMAEIVNERYKASKLDNVAFAALINTDPVLRGNFRSDVTKSNVEAVLEGLGIPNNRARVFKKDVTDDCVFLSGRVAALEDQVNRLTNFLKSKGFDK